MPGRRARLAWSCDPEDTGAHRRSTMGPQTRAIRRSRPTDSRCPGRPPTARCPLAGPGLEAPPPAGALAHPLRSLVAIPAALYRPGYHATRAGRPGLALRPLEGLVEATLAGPVVGQAPGPGPAAVGEWLAARSWRLCAAAGAPPRPARPSALQLTHRHRVVSALGPYRAGPPSVTTPSRSPARPAGTCGAPPPPPPPQHHTKPKATTTTHTHNTTTTKQQHTHHHHHHVGIPRRWRTCTCRRWPERYPGVIRRDELLASSSNSARARPRWSVAGARAGSHGGRIQGVRKEVCRSCSGWGSVHPEPPEPPSAVLLLANYVAHSPSTRTLSAHSPSIWDPYTPPPPPPPHSHPRHVGEFRVRLQERGARETKGPAPVLRQSDLRGSTVRAVAVVHLVSVGEQNRVTVLLERARLT